MRFKIPEKAKAPCILKTKTSCMHKIKLTIFDIFHTTKKKRKANVFEKILLNCFCRKSCF